MSDAIAMANYVANNVKVKVKLKKNVQNVKAVERNIYNHNETTRIHNKKAWSFPFSSGA